MMRVLYIHMIGAFGGASRSLAEAVHAVGPELTARFVAPAGTAADHFGSLGEVVEARGISQFDNTRYSHYRGLRWLVLAREIGYLPATVRALLKARRCWPDIDLIHVNEFTGIVPWLIARRLFKVPVIVHVRSVANDDASLRTRFVSHLLRCKAEAVIAIDETVKESLPADLDVEVIHNSFSQKPSAAATDLFANHTLRASSFKVGFVGNLLRVKGIHELVEAARIVRDAGLDVEFIIVGGDAAPPKGLRATIARLLGVAQNSGEEVRETIVEQGLASLFHFTGATKDIAQAYAKMDVLCFPSHFDAPGRPIFEAAFAGIPSIVAVRNPKPDTIVEGVTGLAIPPRDAEALAAAITQLAGDRARARSMGENARGLAERNFDPAANAAKLVAVYRRVLGRARSS